MVPKHKTGYGDPFLIESDMSFKDTTAFGV